MEAAGAGVTVGTRAGVEDNDQAAVPSPDSAGTAGGASDASGSSALHGVVAQDSKSADPTTNGVDSGVPRAEVEIEEPDAIDEALASHEQN